MNKLDWPKELVDLLFSNIEPPKDYINDCWIWKGKRSKSNYGLFKSRPAHREMYKFYYGEIGLNLYVCHKCDNPPCVNPNHLWLGTTQENTRDRELKQRGAKGEKVGTSKLTNVDVEIIITNIMNNKYTSVKEVASEFNVSPSVIYSIIRGSSWNHIRHKLNITIDELKDQMRKSQNKLTDDDLYNIIDDTENGKFKNVDEIALKYNIDVTVVRKLFTKKLFASRLNQIIDDIDLYMIYNKICQ